MREASPSTEPPTGMRNLAVNPAYVTYFFWWASWAAAPFSAPLFPSAASPRSAWPSVCVSPVEKQPFATMAPTPRPEPALPRLFVFVGWLPSFPLRGRHSRTWWSWPVISSPPFSACPWLANPSTACPSALSMLPMEPTHFRLPNPLPHALRTEDDAPLPLLR